MGSTVPEAAFRLEVEISRGVRESKRLVGEAIRSAYDGQPLEVRQRILAGQSRDAAWITASAWHTAISIATGRIDEREVES